MDSDRIRLAVIGLVAVILQLLLAPILTIGAAVPSFIVVAVLVLVVIDPEEEHYVFAFAMGLVADLTGAAPLGASSIGLLVCAFVLPRIVEMVGNDNVLMSFLIMLAGAFVFELVFAILLSVAGMIGFLDSFAAIVFPCTVYNAVLGFLCQLVLMRLGSGKSGSHGGMTMTNVRFN